MAESVNKKLLSALTEGHEKELRSSARISKTSATVRNNRKSKAQKSTVNDSIKKRKLNIFKVYKIMSCFDFF